MMIDLASRNRCIMRLSGLPAPSLRTVDRLPAVGVLFWSLLYDLPGFIVDPRVPTRFFSLLSGTGAPLLSPRRGFGADRAMQRVRHEQEPLGCRTVALGVPQRQL